MAKLYFMYGTMNTAKSALLITKAYSFRTRNINYLVLKPSTDTRSQKIKSRALSTEEDCVSVAPETNIFDYISDYIRVFTSNPLTWILVDEAQFLSTAQVDQLAHVVDAYNINVMCYGLRTDSNTHLFNGSKRLFEIADTFEEIKATCNCGNKVSINARIDSTGHIITSDSTEAIIDCGAEDKYITMCRACYNRAVAERLSIYELWNLDNLTDSTNSHNIEDASVNVPNSSKKNTTVIKQKNPFETSMTEERFWEIVSAIDWKTKSQTITNYKELLKSCKRVLSASLSDDETVKDFDMKFRELLAKLNLVIKSVNKEPDGYRCSVWDATVEAWRKNPNACPHLSDDSWYDLKCHVIGCGKDDYYKVIDNPFTIADFTDYQENFAYIIHTKSD